MPQKMVQAAAVVDPSASPETKEKNPEDTPAAPDAPSHRIPESYWDQILVSSLCTRRRTIPWFIYSMHRYQTIKKITMTMQVPHADPSTAAQLRFPLLFGSIARLWEEHTTETSAMQRHGPQTTINMPKHWTCTTTCTTCCTTESSFSRP